MESASRSQLRQCYPCLSALYEHLTAPLVAAKPASNGKRVQTSAQATHRKVLQYSVLRIFERGLCKWVPCPNAPVSPSQVAQYQ
jgi:hypothetical protein